MGRRRFTIAGLTGHGVYHHEDYTIFRRGDNILARNGETAVIQFEDDNLLDIINAIRAELPTGGLVRLRNDTYPYGDPLVIEEPNFEIRGAGRNTVIDYDGVGIPITFQGEPLIGGGIRDLTIQSDGGDAHAIRLNAMHSGVFENLRLYDHGGRGFYLDAVDDGCHWNKFEMIEIDTAGYGVSLTSTGTARCNANRFKNFRCLGITNNGFELLNSKGDTNYLEHYGVYGCDIFIDDWYNHIISPRFEGIGAYLEFGTNRGRFNTVIGTNLGERLRGNYWENFIYDAEYGKILNFSNVRGWRDLYVEFYGSILPLNSTLVGTASIAYQAGSYLRCATGANVASTVTIDASNSRPCASAYPFKIKFVRSKLWTTTFQIVRLGLWRGANDFMIFEHNENAGGAANWFARCSNGGAVTQVDTGEAGDNAYHEFEIDWDGTDATFYIDRVLEATINTNIPALTMDPYVYIENLAAANKYIDIDAIWFETDRV